MKKFAFLFFFISDHSVLIVFGKSEFFVDRENSFEETREKVKYRWTVEVLLLVLLQKIWFVATDTLVVSFSEDLTLLSLPKCKWMLF